MNDSILLGFDFSTQQIKVVAVSSHSLDVLTEYFVQFDDDLPEYKTEHGAIHDKDGLTVTSPTNMWVHALDILLDKMKANGFPFHKVVALSGSGQQHGSVYWQVGSHSTLANLDAKLSLKTQLENAFSVKLSPIWMDASTTNICRMIEKVVGGPATLFDLTGARAFERYTGSQIKKIFGNYPELYHNTERISLVSSFATSIFLGKYADTESADASGMNLMDIRKNEWLQSLCDFVAPDLVAKLGETVSFTAVLGNISSYFCEKYGFSESCKVVPFSGDNPCTLAGLCVGPGHLVASLGTSECYFLWSEQFPTITELGCVVMSNTMDPAGFMPMLVYKNGSLVRESVRDEFGGGSWETFNSMLVSSPPGNDGFLGLFYDLPEIVPDAVCGRFRFAPDGTRLEGRFPTATHEVRAVVEGHMLAKRYYVERVGFQVGSDHAKVLATGGASSNAHILQVMADVFNSPVYTTPVANSAALGGAHRASLALLGDKYWSLANKVFSSRTTLAASPNLASVKVYEELYKRFTVIFESQILSSVS